MKKTELFEAYEKVEGDVDCIVLKIHMPGGETETIINPKVTEKMAYIDKTYDANLVHTNCEAIYIEDAIFCTSNDGETFDFGEAIATIKDGGKVSRKGWNGKDQYVYYIPASCADTDGIKYNHYMALKTVSGEVSTWVPSVTDCLAEDWFEV